jgi:hypothetical protein
VEVPNTTTLFGQQPNMHYLFTLSLKKAVETSNCNVQAVLNGVSRHIHHRRVDIIAIASLDLPESFGHQVHIELKCTW